MPEYISESLSMQLGAEFTLLRTPLFAGVKRTVRMATSFW